MADGGFFHRVIADDDWAYRRGRVVLARFGELTAALEHAKGQAAANPPSEVILHDNQVTIVATYE